MNHFNTFIFKTLIILYLIFNFNIKNFNQISQILIYLISKIDIIFYKTNIKIEIYKLF